MNIAAALAQLAPAGTALAALAGGSLAAPLEELERRLSQIDGPAPVGEICADLFASGGKRLRALTTLVVGQALAVAPEQALGLAEVMELSHGATLLHDDVIDESDTRRARPTARRRWSNTFSVLAGDHLLLRAIDLVASFDNAGLTAAHRKTLGELLGAEVAQNVAVLQRDITVDGYLAIARGKTGALLAFACAAPALCSAWPSRFDSLWRFGLGFGVAFQVADDVRDLTRGDPTKSAWLDLHNGVPSLPLRIAARDSSKLGARLAALPDRALDAAGASELVRQVVELGALERAVDIGRQELVCAERELRQASVEQPIPALHAVCRWLEAELDCGARCG
jgi:geranylgeranyl pyrophosphate synthase